MELPRGLQNARFRALGENHALGVPLHFFDDIADETHERKVAVTAETAKGICRRLRLRIDLDFFRS